MGAKKPIILRPGEASTTTQGLIKGGLELEGGKLGLCSDLLRKLLGHEVGGLWPLPRVVMVGWLWLWWMVGVLDGCGWLMGSQFSEQQEQVEAIGSVFPYVHMYVYIYNIYIYIYIPGSRSDHLYMLVEKLDDASKSLHGKWLFH